MDEKYLEMQAIDKSFGNTHALNNVDFDIKHGEVHALIGTNGSGKSTLMNILSGGLHADSGCIKIGGKEIQFKNPAQAIANGIVIIHQELKLFPALTVAENIFFGRYPRHRGLVDWAKMNRNAAEELKKLNADIDPKQLVSKLSVAKQQLVEICKALSNNSKVLIMDEPTASLTQDDTKVLFEAIRAARSRGVGLIYISHRLDEVLEIADRVTVLRDGVHICSVQNEGRLTKDFLVEQMIAGHVNQQIKDSSSPKFIGETVLEVRQLSLKGKLNDVSFQLKKGEVLGIAGLVGSGRTELLKTLFGSYHPDGGEVLVRGKVQRMRSPCEAVHKGVALLPEDRKGEGLMLDMSIADNIVFASFSKFTRGALLSRARQTHAVAEQAKALSIKLDRQGQQARDLSGGNQQKVVIAKWLVADSDILMMDEPTRGIDVGAKYEIYALIDKLARTGKSIIFVSSELEEVAMVSDRILVMHEGRMTGELAANATVEEMMKYAT